MGFLREGEQLQLSLGLRKEPWDGRSPRALTKVGLGLFLRPEPPSHGVKEWDDQLLFWPVERHTPKKAPGASTPGAPLLLECRLPFGEGDGDGS